jgi:hypothetical protein
VSHPFLAASLRPGDRREGRGSREAVLDALRSAGGVTGRLVHPVRVLPHHDVLALLGDRSRLAR